MNFKNTFFGFLTVFVLFSCSKDEVNKVVSFDNISITTKQPVFSPNSITFETGGVLSSERTGESNYRTGICYSFLPNPTISDQIIYNDFYSSTVFNIVVDNLAFGQTYYIKAFVEQDGTGQVKYGNEVSLQIPSYLSTGIVKNISVNSFSVDVTVSNNLVNNSERGICYSTSQNPTISNESFNAPTNGSGSFTISVDGSFGSSSPFYFVNSNTTYYLRSYVRIVDKYYYGNEVSFRTCGYIGGSGGYVFYDKGEFTNGWRYLEAAPAQLETSSFYFFKWMNTNCTATSFISGINNEIGTGLENTQIIRNICNYNNVAATMCNATSLNNKNDWFLPSIDELKQMYKLEFTNQISVTTYLLSSSQSSNSLCFVLKTTDGTIETRSKTSDQIAWQVRRF